MRSFDDGAEAALKEISEEVVADFFEHCGCAATHRNRKNPTEKDSRLVKAIQGKRIGCHAAKRVIKDIMKDVKH